MDKMVVDMELRGLSANTKSAYFLTLNVSQSILVSQQSNWVMLKLGNIYTMALFTSNAAALMLLCVTTLSSFSLKLHLGVNGMTKVPRIKKRKSCRTSCPKKRLFICSMLPII